MKTHPCLLSSLVCALTLSWLPAQKPVDASAGNLDTVRKLHAEVVAQRDVMKDAIAKLRNFQRGSEQYNAAMRSLEDMRKQQQGPQAAFEAAFVAVDIKAFDLEKDAELLKDVLPAIANDTEKADRAVAACRFYLEHFGKERGAQGIRARALPMALLCSGDFVGATETVAKLAAEQEGDAKASTLLTLGDLAAANGDVAKAREHYLAAEKCAAENTMSYVTLRKELIGETAPEIDSKTWIGAEARTLGSMKGKIVLVDFWATWCGPCRAVMPALSELFHEHKDHGLQVMGVTRFYKNGYLPANKEQIRSGGQSVPVIAPEEFAGHVTAFRDNTGIEYPFVIGEQSDFEHYFVKGIPTLVVVGRDGKVALVCVGSGSEALLKFTVERLLAAK